MYAGVLAGTREACVIKIANPAKHEKGRRLMKREKHILQMLQSVDCVPRLLLSFPHGFAMSAHGATLADVDDPLHFFPSALRALQKLHEAKFVHQDVKPENFLLRRSSSKGKGCTDDDDDDDDVVIIDFGLTRQARPPGRGGATTGPHRFVGTLIYASVAAHQGRTQTPHDDLESFGYMAMHLMRCKLPWSGARIPMGSNETTRRLVGEMKQRTRLRTIAGQNPVWGAIADFAEKSRDRPIPYDTLAEILSSVGRK